MIGVSLEVIQKAYSQGRSTEGEKTMTFDAEAGGIPPKDEPGKVWNLLTGDGLDMKQMSLIPHLNIYWFAWVHSYLGLNSTRTTDPGRAGVRTRMGLDASQNTRHPCVPGRPPRSRAPSSA